MSPAQGVSIVSTPFAIPYKSPLALAAGSVHEHCGVLVEVGNGVSRGFGEVAPGPGTTRTDVLAIADRIDQQQEPVTDFADALAAELRPPPRHEIAPDLFPGVEAATLDWVARLRGEPLHEALTGAGFDLGPVDVNAMIDRTPSDTREKCIDEAIGQGYRCLKIKLAATELESCIASIRCIRERHGDAVAVRLDCNGEWSVEEARAAIERLAPLDIEYIEQPTRTINELREVRRTSSIPIAADESASRLELVETALELEAVDVLVLKPARLGLTASLQAACAAQAAGVDCVVTSNLETSLGIASALQVAAIVDASHPVRKRAHGLGTVGLLAGDIVEPGLVPRRGALRIPAEAGCGVSPTPSEVDRWRLR